MGFSGFGNSNNKKSFKYIYLQKTYPGITDKTHETRNRQNLQNLAPSANVLGGKCFRVFSRAASLLAAFLFLGVLSMTISKILTIDQVAELLNVRPSWIYQRTCDGTQRGTGRGRRRTGNGSQFRPNPVDVLDRMPHFKAGRLLGFDRDEVLAWFAKFHRSEKQAGIQPGDEQNHV